MNTLGRYTMFKNVVIVGGEGFIGRYLHSKHPDWTSIDLKTGDDFCSYDWVKCDAIVLLAAELGNSLDDYIKNLRIYEALARTVKKNKTQPYVVYVSSAAVYDDNSMRHYEDEFLVPPTLYGKSKRLGESVVQDICEKYTILRLGNVYAQGRGNGVIDRFRRGERTIYGDGDQVRDYVHVDKVTKAISRIIAYPHLYENQTYNVSSGVGLKVVDVFEKYGKGEPIYADPRDFDVACSILDNLKARRAKLV